MIKSKTIIIILDLLQKGSILKYYNEFLDAIRLNREEIKNGNFTRFKVINFAGRLREKLNRIYKSNTYP